MDATDRKHVAGRDDGPARYPPISDYALIGNRHTCALVSRGGSIDWCCLPHLDSASVFAALLDHARGGRWRIAPMGEARATRRYLGASSVLETRFETETGVVVLTDFLPIRSGRGEEMSHSAHTVARWVRCERGSVEVEVEWMPRPSYARADVSLERRSEGVRASAPGAELWLQGIPEEALPSLEGAAVEARLTLEAGEELHLLCTWGAPVPEASAERARAYLSETLVWWEEWEAGCRMEPGADRWSEMVRRSGMVLKLLTNETTGAIAAAPTTSLPEEIGGVRNWDYRYCWVRDASMTAQAFATLGHPEDGAAFLAFLEAAAQQHHDPARVQVLYGLQGETRLPEFTLGHLDGYRGSRPVRIGNAAAVQRQLDVYGELLQAAHDLLELDGTLSEGQWSWLAGVADYVCGVWRLPDRGIWEVRGPELHFTYSKLMCWVALDRAIRLAERLGAAPVPESWTRERAALRSIILSEGYSEEQGSFVQSFGSSVLDASSLLVPIVGFLPADDPRVQGTIDAALRGLTVNGLVYRYRTDETADGVGGGEGAFVVCTFWLSIALSMSGRVAEAREVFEGVLARVNDVGLLAEEIDPETGEFLGNFPQAFSHLGLIGAAHYLGLALGPERER